MFPRKMHRVLSFAIKINRRNLNTTPTFLQKTKRPSYKEFEPLTRSGGTKCETALYTEAVELPVYPDLTIGFLGHGKMYQALAGGFLKANLIKPENLLASYINQEEDEIQEEDCVKINSNEEVVRQAQVVIIAVKPHVVESVIDQILPYVEEEHLIISVAAGWKTENLQSKFSPDTKVVCVAPNTPSLVGCGASVCSFGENVTDDDKVLVEKLFTTVGMFSTMPDKQLDIVTGLSGSGPAYAFIAMEALSDGAVRMGMPRDIATKLSAQMLMGAAKMVLETGKHPGELKDAVCSPGGTTIAAVHSLERNGFRATLMDAVEASTNKAKQLGAENGSSEKSN